MQKNNVDINGINIVYYSAGNASESIFLLHGGGVDSAMLSWKEIIPLLSDEYRVIVPDLPGYGDSDKIKGEYSLKFYTEILKAFIEKLSDGPIVFVGISLGGGISINLSLNYPELIKILVPLDAWGLFKKLPRHRLLYWFVHSRLNDNLNALVCKFPSIIKFSLRYNLFGDKSKISNELVCEIIEAMKKPDADRAFISFQRSEIKKEGVATDLFSRLNEIKIPVLLVHGSLDKLIPLEGAVQASKIIPNCEIYIMQGCKHWPAKERPQEFAAVLKSYIKRHNGRLHFRT